MITGGVNPYTTRLRLKLYRVANYNGLNPKRRRTKCPWRGVVHSVAVIPGGDVFLLGRWPPLSVPVTGLSIGEEASGVRGSVGRVSSWDQSCWSRVIGVFMT